VFNEGNNTSVKEPMTMLYQGSCGRCGQKVRTDENYLRAHLWASTAVFHWNCLVALMKEHREVALEDATWKASRLREE
jgi:hypothetical protein